MLFPITVWRKLLTLTLLILLVTFFFLLTLKISHSSVLVGTSVWLWCGHAIGTLSGCCHPTWTGSRRWRSLKCGLDLCGSPSKSDRAASGDHICPVLHPGGSREAERGRETSRVADDDGWRLWFLLITPQRAVATPRQLGEVSMLHAAVFSHYFLICCSSSSSSSAFQASWLLVSFFFVSHGRKMKEQNI